MKKSTFAVSVITIASLSGIGSVFHALPAKANPINRFMVADARLEKLQTAADQGDAEAQLIVGDIYSDGSGVPQDLDQARSWYRKAADQGIAKAQIIVGDMYYNGSGVPQSFAQALSWYRKAADQGNAKAQYSLGDMYYNGSGVPQSFAQALSWYRKAADQGNAKAQYSLGFMYQIGLVVPQDIVVAYALYWTSKQNEPSPYRLREAAARKDQLYAVMTRYEFNEAQILISRMGKVGVLKAIGVP